MSVGDTWRDVTLAERLQRRTAPRDHRGCQLWEGYVDPQGYGQVRLPIVGTRTTAHRAAWIADGRPIPTGHEVTVCVQDRRCTTPEHLGTHTPGHRR